MSNFLQERGNYRGLVVFQKTECIYDITYYFANRYLAKGDRTVDQMIQAARSGRQNIAEGSKTSTTSREMEIKLLNVARASLQELLLDYEDYLRVRGKEIWAKDNPKAVQTRQVCKKHSDSAYYREAIQTRSDEVICNTAITLIHQADLLLGKLITRCKDDFLQNGGIREEMTRARVEFRKKQQGW